MTTKRVRHAQQPRRIIAQRPPASAASEPMPARRNATLQTEARNRITRGAPKNPQPYSTNECIRSSIIRHAEMKRRRERMPATSPPPVRAPPRRSRSGSVAAGSPAAFTPVDHSNRTAASAFRPAPVRQQVYHAAGNTAMIRSVEHQIERQREEDGNDEGHARRDTVARHQSACLAMLTHATTFRNTCRGRRPFPRHHVAPRPHASSLSHTYAFF